MGKSWIDIPFAPRRCPFFYGWVILAGSILGILASMPGQTMGVGVFTEHLIEALGLTRTELATAYMYGTLISALILPFAGKLIDRLGTRVMVVASALGLGLSLVALAKSDQALLINPASKFVLPMASITLCFFLVRFFGQGCLTVVARVAVGKWFNYRRGLAAAISSAFLGVGFNSSPLFFHWLVQALEWRGSLLALAAVIGGGMSLIGWLVYRDNPEECGLVMDGVDDEDWLRRMAARGTETKREFTRGEAARTMAFWAFTLGVSLQGLVFTAMTFHVESLGVEAGISAKRAYAIFLLMPLFSVPANLAGSWLSDYIRMKWLLVVMMVGQSIGVVGLLDFGGLAGRALMIVGFGISMGLFGAILTVAFPRFFGREHLGAISGLNMSVMVVASAIGPVLFSWFRDWTGSYGVIILIGVFLPMLVLLMALRAENPQERLVAQ